MNYWFSCFVRHLFSVKLFAIIKHVSSYVVTVSSFYLYACVYIHLYDELSHFVWTANGKDEYIHLYCYPHIPLCKNNFYGFLRFLMIILIDINDVGLWCGPKHAHYAFGKRFHRGWDKLFRLSPLYDCFVVVCTCTVI